MCLYSTFLKSNETYLKLILHPEKYVGSKQIKKKTNRKKVEKRSYNFK